MARRGVDGVVFGRVDAARRGRVVVWACRMGDRPRTRYVARMPGIVTIVGHTVDPTGTATHLSWERPGQGHASASCAV